MSDYHSYHNFDDRTYSDFVNVQGEELDFCMWTRFGGGIDAEAKLRDLVINGRLRGCLVREAALCALCSDCLVGGGMEAEARLCVL